MQFYDEVAVQAFHAHLRSVLNAPGARIDAFYYCSHHREDTVKELATRCLRR